MKIINTGFDLFGFAHFTWLTIILLFIGVGTVIYKKFSPLNQVRMERGIAWFIIVSECYKDYYLWQHGEFTLEFLPLHLCSLAMIALLLNSYFHDKTTNEFIYSLTLPAGIAALLFANWTERAPWGFMSSFSFIFHGFIVLYPIMRLSAKKFRPNYKELWRVALLLIIIVPPIYFFNKVYDTNFLFLNTPSPGSPLVPLATLFGNPGYIYALIVIVVFLWGILYSPFLKRKQVHAYKKIS